MNKPLVSIIMPTYNDANTICRAVDSCLKQTYNNIEIIVIDDGSTDNTKEVLSKYNSDERFKYIYQENQERSVARNHGLDIAKGDYIQLLDADDEIYPTKIEKQIGFLVSYPEYFMVYCGTVYLDKNKKIIDTLEKKYTGIINDELLKRNFITINAPLTRKNNSRFSKDLNKLEDWEYWILSTHNQQIGYIDEILSVVNINIQRTKQYILQMIWSEIHLYDKLLANKLFYKNRCLLLVFKYKRYISLLVRKVLL